MHTVLRHLSVRVHACMRARARVCAAQMNVRSPMLALRFRPNVSAAKTTGCCLPSTAITLVHLTSDLCHADRNKIGKECQSPK